MKCEYICDICGNKHTDIKVIEACENSHSDAIKAVMNRIRANVPNKYDVRIVEIPRFKALNLVITRESVKVVNLAIPADCITQLDLDDIFKFINNVEAALETKILGKQANQMIFDETVFNTLNKVMEMNPGKNLAVNLSIK